MIPVEARRECPALEAWVLIRVKMLRSTRSSCNGELGLIRRNDGCGLEGQHYISYRRRPDGLFQREKRAGCPAGGSVTSELEAAL